MLETINYLTQSIVFHFQHSTNWNLNCVCLCVSTYFNFFYCLVERSKEIVSLAFVLFLILIGFSNSLDYHDIFQLGHHSINGVKCQRAKTNRNNQSRVTLWLFLVNFFLATLLTPRWQIVKSRVMNNCRLPLIFFGWKAFLINLSSSIYSREWFCRNIKIILFIKNWSTYNFSIWIHSDRKNFFSANRYIDHFNQSIFFVKVKIVSLSRLHVSILFWFIIVWFTLKH